MIKEINVNDCNCDNQDMSVLISKQSQLIRRLKIKLRFQRVLTNELLSYKTKYESIVRLLRRLKRDIDYGAGGYFDELLELARIETDINPKPKDH